MKCISRFGGALHQILQTFIPVFRFSNGRPLHRGRPSFFLRSFDSVRGFGERGLTTGENAGGSHGWWSEGELLPSVKSLLKIVAADLIEMSETSETGEGDLPNNSKEKSKSTQTALLRKVALHFLQQNFMRPLPESPTETRWQESAKSDASKKLSCATST